MPHPLHSLSSDGAGAKAPPIAYGTGTLWFKGPGDGFDPKAVDAIKTALGLGYRHIDGAQIYGTEAEIGQAIKESGVARSDLFLTTKTVSIDDVEAALEASLAELQTDYIDLYLIHNPFGAKSKEHLQAVWRSMERCHERGLARNIGVSSFDISHLQTVLETAQVKPVVNQIELHPYLQQPELLAYLKSQDIAVEAVAALTPLTKVIGGPVDEPCRQLATKYGVSDSSILLRWAIDQGVVTVTTSSKRERLQTYLDELMKFTLTPDQVQIISRAAGDTRFREFYAKEFEAYEAQK